MDIRIEHPLWLLLGLPLAGYFAWTVWRMRRPLAGEQRSAIALRALALGLLLAALADPYARLPAPTDRIVFLIDRSASMKANGAAARAEAFAEEALRWKKPRHEVGIYSFGGSFQTDVAPTLRQVRFPTLQPLRNAGDTDIARTLQLAAASVPPGQPARFVLLSDGNETKGSAKQALSLLRGGEIEVDTVSIAGGLADDASLASFETPSSVARGQLQKLTVRVQSSRDKRAQLLVTENDRPLFKRSIRLAAGLNEFSFAHRSPAEGLIKYEATLIAPGDASLENNALVSMTNVESPPAVLVVSKNGAQSPIARALDRRALRVHEMAPADLPSELSGYLPYRAILFDDVPGNLVGEQKMALLERAVKTFGTGFLMSGGPDSFGLGGYFQTPIERLLPVDMELTGKHILPSLALQIALDRSGSMSGEKFELAKEAAARSVEMLRREDAFGFIAFDDTPWDVIPIGELGDRKAAIDTIASVPVGGGTAIFPALLAGVENISGLAKQRKHVILISDGQSESGDYEGLMETARASGLTVSTVAIGSDADRGLLARIAEAGGGRYYEVVDPDTVPAILSRETAMISRTYIEDHPFYPRLFGGIPQWSALFRAGMPQMNAYIAASAKPAASVILESAKGDPVLAEWRYGLGRTLAYTSDAAGAWSGGFARWKEWGNFWNTAVSRLLPAYGSVPYAIQREADGTYTIADRSGRAALLDVAVVDEKGKSVPVNAEPTAPGELSVSIPDEPGLVFFRLKDANGALFSKGLAVPYSEEYESKPPNERLLAQLAAETGGRSDLEPRDAFRPLASAGTAKQPLQQWLLLAALVIFFADVTLRRFGWGALRALPGRLLRRRAREAKSAEEPSLARELLRKKQKR